MLFITYKYFLIWSEDQPEELQKLAIHPELAGDITGPYFFKDAANRNVTVNGERYRETTLVIKFNDLQALFVRGFMVKL